MGFSYDQTPLGRPTAYCSEYDPSLLCPIPRADKRRELGIEEAALPFRGVDVWTAYELSWLDRNGFPRVAVGRFVFDAASPFLIESKSFKLYLNSFNDTRFATPADVRATLVRDLSRASGAPVSVSLFSVEEAALAPVAAPAGECLDGLSVPVEKFVLSPDFLRTMPGSDTVCETLYSHLLKSNCLVTGQPDWGTVVIQYEGRPIDRVGLIRYIVSFRHHWEFHEQCVERIFTDIRHRCRPDRLTVYARYLRRGGLDINPLRTTEPLSAVAGSGVFARLLRQ